MMCRYFNICRSGLKVEFPKAKKGRVILFSVPFPPEGRKVHETIAWLLPSSSNIVSKARHEARRIYYLYSRVSKKSS